MMYEFEDYLTRAVIILESMGFDVKQISPIKYNDTWDIVTFFYKDDSVWQVDLENKKKRHRDNETWTEWENEK